MQLNHLFSLGREKLWNPESDIGTEGVLQEFVVVGRVDILVWWFASVKNY